MDELIELECSVQNYAWGKIGLNSSVAQLANAKGTPIDSDKPYAEYWMGTHKNGPAKIASTGELLGDWLKKNSQAISENEDIAKKWADVGELPYLFKVLSVNKALSIQAHPDKKLAEQLHADRPQVYKDPNHKPEMACAITPFEALAGFFPLADIVDNIGITPELKSLLESTSEGKELFKSNLLDAKEEEQQQQREVLKQLFSILMNSDPKLVEEKVQELGKRLESLGNDIKMPNKLALRLISQYPGDVGVFCAYFMCYRVLQPGQAVFLGANEPHAYLAGDCAEIMACSDNVVRAGLTPKLRDVSTLCEMLTYRQPSHSGAEFHPGNLLEGKQLDKFSKLYSPPDPAVTEFQMERIVLEKTDGEYVLPPPHFASIILVLSGKGNASSTKLERGGLFLQPVTAKNITIQVTTEDEPLIFFRASMKAH